ncbi:hypothetical protein IJ750_06055 [bacterium]|nr:hypothetical protein [bacterium]MBR1776617.1 hypothetical protein [bacterium]
MKKYFVVMMLIIASAVVIADDSKFAYSLKNCTSFTESGNVQTEGMNVSSTKQIVGWENNKCVYKEIVNFNGMNVTTTCRFTQPQINEIISVMNAYNLVQQYSHDSIDTSSLDAVKNNPVVKVWNKYLQDSSVCTLSGLK